MATRRRRTWLYVCLGLPLLFFGAVGVMRLGRGRCNPPELVRDKVVHEHSAVVDLYGARIGDQVILFDTGADPEGRPVDALLARLGRTRNDVSDVFLTHGHSDHTAGASACAKARLHGGIGDSDMMSHRGPIVPRAAAFMGWVLPVAPVMLTDAFLGRAEVHVGDDVVVALPFGGHTPGSMLYLYDGVLFVGDTLNIAGGKLVDSPSVFSIDPPHIRKGMAALGTTIDLAQVKRICTGHGGCTPEGETQRLLADYLKQGS